MVDQDKPQRTTKSRTSSHVGRQTKRSRTSSHVGMFTLLFGVVLFVCYNNLNDSSAISGRNKAIDILATLGDTDSDQGQRQLKKSSSPVRSDPKTITRKPLGFAQKRRARMEHNATRMEHNTTGMP
mmetsp:Transcript_5383/g.7910  ORF Transcript_5383/g.7910 Transcript_5383/m.7910 type:complete len:126 (-) Transcript_5383:357-734(-)